MTEFYSNDAEMTHSFTVKTQFYSNDTQFHSNDTVSQ
jgi:hypothetical protein